MRHTGTSIRGYRIKRMASWGHSVVAIGFASLRTLVVLLAGAPALAGDATRLATFAPQDEPTYYCPTFGSAVAAATGVYFTVGTELAVADVDAGVVRVIRDVRTGDHDGGIGDLVVVGKRLFFLADDGHLGRELWTSDGSPAGTTLVHEFRAGRYSSDVSYLTSFNGKLYFSGPINTLPFQTLWASDGTDAGTIQAANIGRPGPMLALQSHLLCGSLSTFGVSSTLWRTDGTTGGSVKLATFAANAVVHAFSRFGAGALVWVRTGVTARELWRTDLTPAGTVKIADVDAPSIAEGSNETGWAVEAGGVLYFVGQSQAGARTVWRTDGTGSGTVRLATISAPEMSVLGPPYLAAIGDWVYFAGADGEHGVELWRSDGTVAGTSLAADINPGSGASSPQWLTAAGGTLFFVAGDPYSGRELWASDGTNDGTAPAADLCPGPFGSFPALPHSSETRQARQLVAWRDRVAFFASAGVDGCRLWVSDGTDAGTRAVGDGVPPVPTWSQGYGISAPEQVGVNGSVLLLDPYHSTGTWFTDGTAGVFAPWPGPAMLGLFGEAKWPRLHGQMLVNGAGVVVRTAGTVAGSAPVFDGPMLGPSNAENGTFYFWRDGDVVWRSDGTAAGTRAVRAFRPRPYYYRVPWALALAGETAAAMGVLGWIRRRFVGPDGTWDPPQDPGLQQANTYFETCLAYGAHLLRQYDVARLAMAHALRSQDPATGGVFMLSGRTRADDVQLLFLTCQLGMSALLTGERDAAIRAGGFCLRLWQDQPDLPGRLFTMATRGGIVTEPPPGIDRRHVVNDGRSVQEYHYNGGIAAAFLGQLHAATGEGRWLEAAKAYQRFSMESTDRQFETKQVCKSAWRVHPGGHHPRGSVPRLAGPDGRLVRP